MTDLKSKLTEHVKNNSIQMVPRWKFVAYSTLGVVGIIFTFLVTVFVVSLILFMLSRYGLMYMPFFGIMASMHALGAVPPLLFGCTIVLLVLIEAISRRYAFSFKRPLFVTLLVVTSGTAIAGFVVSETTMHEHIREFAISNRIEMMKSVYERPVPSKRMDGLDVLRGEVVATTSTTTVLRLFDGTVVTAYATTSKTIISAPLVGDDIVVIGNYIGEEFEMSGMHNAPHTPFRKYHEKRGVHMMDRNNTLQYKIHMNQGVK